jgi:hypothetical protein
MRDDVMLIVVKMTIPVMDVLQDALAVFLFIIIMVM